MASSIWKKMWFSVVMLVFRGVLTKKLESNSNRPLQHTAGYFWIPFINRWLSQNVRRNPGFPLQIHRFYEGILDNPQLRVAPLASKGPGGMFPRGMSAATWRMGSQWMYVVNNHGWVLSPKALRIGWWNPFQMGLKKWLIKSYKCGWSQLQVLTSPGMALQVSQTSAKTLNW